MRRIQAYPTDPIRALIHAAELAHLHPIGNRRAGALIGPAADLSWWTPHSVEHDAAFYSLVHPDGGRLSLRLTGCTNTTTAAGIGDAPRVRTTMRSPDAVVTVDDHMADGAHGFADGSIVRLVTVLSGRAELRAHIVGGSRFAPPRRTYRGTDSCAWISTDTGAAVIGIRGIDATQPDRPLVLHAGESTMITLSPDAVDQRVRREEYDRRSTATDRVWRQRLDNAYDGPWRMELRSWLRQLHLLTNRDSGALLRALTTSLPAQPGGDRQVDERLAYLEDAARYVRLLERLDRADLVEDTRRWTADALVRDVQRPPRARRSDATDAAQETDLMLAGWEGHQPVRRSDVAAGAVDLAAVAGASLILDANRDRRTLRAVATFLADQVMSPSVRDGGRWAGRKAAGTSGHSSNMTPWVSSAIAIRQALGAAAATERRHDPLSLDAAEWDLAARTLSDRLRRDGCFGSQATAGWRRTFDDDTSDAQLLRWIAPADGSVPFPELPGDDEGEPRLRVANAVTQLIAQLDDHGLVHRHLPHADDGFAPGQAADVSATADTVTALCRLGRWDEANERMETLMLSLRTTADGVVTVPSHLDPRTRRHLGNRPHAPTLLSLCDAVLALQPGPA